jgi:hypothetical protein
MVYVTHFYEQSMFIINTVSLPIKFKRSKVCRPSKKSVFKILLTSIVSCIDSSHSRLRVRRNVPPQPSMAILLLVWIGIMMPVICRSACGDAPFKLLFGSCQHQDLREYAAKIWSRMELEEANEFVLLGDAIYGDHRIFLGWSKMTSVSEMTRRYGLIQTDPRWRRLLASVKRGRAIGTWDDHDYGVNGGGHMMKEKVSFQKLFLDFLGEPVGSKVRQQKGLYQSYDFLSGRVVLIVLDLRYFAHRDAGILLGHAQWNFVEQVRELLITSLF